MISPRSSVSSPVADSALVHDFVVIAQGVKIASDVVIHPHVVIESGVEIGRGAEILPGSYLGKQPTPTKAISRPVGSYGPTLIGERCRIGPNAVIYYDVVIGDDTLVGDGVSIREGVRVGRASLLARNVTVNYETTIGTRTRVMDLTHLTGKMVVGDDVFISAGVMTANDNAMGELGLDDQVAGPIIEDHARIGLGAILLPSVRVGRGAIVGAGAVVTRDVAPHTRVLGVPAKPR